MNSQTFVNVQEISLLRIIPKRKCFRIIYRSFWPKPHPYFYDNIYKTRISRRELKSDKAFSICGEEVYYNPCMEITMKNREVLKIYFRTDRQLSEIFDNIKIKNPNIIWTEYKSQ